MTEKLRLSASVDASLLTAAQEAVSRGLAESVSAWVNDALKLKFSQDDRLAALDAFITGFEEEHGEITAEEMEAAARRARGRAVVVRSTP